MISRRQFLAALSAAIAQRPLGNGRLIETLLLGDPARPDNPPLNQLLGSGLDARLFTDLSGLTRDSRLTPTERFFIRTAAPDTLPDRRAWSIALGGRVRQGQALPLERLAREATGRGVHLLECAGNTNPNNYGLMSAARWDGTPIGAVLDRAGATPGRHRILVSGVDDHEHPSRTSVPGASWIFTRDDLERAGAFLATGMNGAPLPRHHGGPVRLLVPGWYGCAAIKWVDRIDLVADDVQATTQMQEFAERTHQPLSARLAREFEPAIIDTAALPVRVERWLVDDRTVYRVVGVIWGGSQPTSALQIRFRTNGPWVNVDNCPVPKTTATWSVWTHMWLPEAPGLYQIVLRVNDPAIRTRRLDLFFYIRMVEIP